MGDCIGTESVDCALDREVLGQPRLWVFIGQLIVPKLLQPLTSFLLVGDGPILRDCIFDHCKPIITKFGEPVTSFRTGTVNQITVSKHP